MHLLKSQLFRSIVILISDFQSQNSGERGKSMFMSWRPDWSTQYVAGQPRQNRRTQYLKDKQNPNKCSVGTVIHTLQDS